MNRGEVFDIIVYAEKTGEKAGLLFSFLMLFVAYPLANAITVMIEIGAARAVRKSGGKQERAEEKTVRD